MKKYFTVSFQYSETTYCTNIAHSESVEAVENEYSKYQWYKISEATEAEVEAAKRKGMPVIEIESKKEDSKMGTYSINQELNGIEIKFDSKPDEATLDALKGSGFRWHRAKKVWYAKQTAERLELAQRLTDGQPAPAAKAAKVEKINLDNLGSNRPASLWGADLAKAIRDDLKKRGVSGVTVRSRRVTHDTGITVTIKASEADFVSIEEMKLRRTFTEVERQAFTHGAFCGERWIYSGEWDRMTAEERESAYDAHIRYYANRVEVNEYHLINCRNDYHNITSAFYEKICAVFRIANQWNWDRSDSMTDYFDVGYYLDIDVKVPEDFTAREEMTAEEREAYEAEIAAEEARKEAEFQAWQAEQEEARKRAEEARKEHEKARAIVDAETTVTDLEPEEYLYITNLHGGAGKEANLEELNETLESCHYLTEDAVITRRVNMTEEAYASFCKMFLDDFEWLRDMGGTGSEDVRLEGVKNMYQLNTEQRESIKWYICNAVAVYVGEELRLVCDPQGHSYSRYTYRPTQDSQITKADPITKAQEEESKTKPEFYFPEPVTEQAKNITPGEQITVYQGDGWMLNTIYAGCGTVAAVTEGTWAQYNGVKIIFTSGKSVFIRDNKDCLIYKGIKPALPASVTQKRINDHMSELFNCDKLLPNTLAYYAERGERPLLDTMQR